ncbi:MAG: proline--tRNA ligase [Candidatus Pacearchaeota archaeon]|nr:MAG: proline--tRNA ligase [Candidatus Pacearchaeota archaeon]
MKKTDIGLTNKKKENFSGWYTEVIKKAKLMDYSSVSGGIVILPNAYFVWQKIQDFLNKEFKKIGVKNAYFPSLIPESLLKKEKQHIKGFEPEVAWVTEAGKTRLSERLAIRPTSETIMYDSFSKWIRSYKDLPLKINQWNNVVRWEFKHPIPFLRTREFLWQEGHSVFSSKEEADKEVLEIINLYERVYNELLAIPVLRGKKTENEKFAGADYTLSLEAILPNKKVIQAATSHNLGQNFSKAFDIVFLDKNEKEENAWQTSWGFSTRSLGIMIATHADDKGMIFPPKVAPIQVVIIPIFFEGYKNKILNVAKKVKDKLKEFEVFVDDREDYSAGWKFNEWELKGIPLRIEIGPNEIKNKEVLAVRRDNLKKEKIKISKLNSRVKYLLDDIQKELFKRAKKDFLDSIKRINSFNEIKTKENFVFEVCLCNKISCEKKVNNQGLKVLILSLDKNIFNNNCFVCGEKSSFVAYIGKSY